MSESLRYDACILEYILEQQSWSERDAAALVFQVLKAIQYLHARGSTFRLLDESNCCVFQSESGPQIKLDYLSTMANGWGCSNYLECMGQSRGLWFVSPEILVSEQYGNEIDIWTVGTMCFSMYVLE